MVSSFLPTNSATARGTKDPIKLDFKDKRCLFENSENGEGPGITPRLSTPRLSARRQTSLSQSAGSMDGSPLERPTERKLTYGQSNDGTSKDDIPVRIIVRCRPPLPGYKESPQLQIRAEDFAFQHVRLEVDPSAWRDPLVDSKAQEMGLRGSRPPQTRTFRCNRFLDDSSTQADAFEQAAPLVDRVMQGSSAAVLCYGVNGAGKSFTLMGPDSTSPHAQELGIAGRAGRRIFSQIEERSMHGEGFRTRASILEVHTDDGIQGNIVDLLSSNSGAPLELKQDTSSPDGWVCEGLRDAPIQSLDNLQDLLREGRKRRFVEKSKADSPVRSHCFIIITVECLKDGVVMSRSRLTLVDLAASDAVTSASADENDEDISRRRALANHRMLTYLGTVITNVNAGVVPGQRGNALTLLLRDCLGRDARSVLIANIGPEAERWSDTFATLGSAQQMMQARTVEKAQKSVGHVTKEKSHLSHMKERHMSILSHLQAKVQEESGKDKEERNKMIKDIDELNKQLLTKSSAEQVMGVIEESSRKMDEFKTFFSDNIATGITSLQKQSNEDLEGFRVELENKAKASTELAQQRQLEALTAQAESLQSQIKSAIEARKRAQGETEQLRIKLSSVDGQVTTYESVHEDFTTGKADFEKERQEMKEKASEQLKKIAELEGTSQRFQIQADVLSAEVQRLKTDLSSREEDFQKEKEAWRTREQELMDRLQATRKSLEELRMRESSLKQEALAAHSETTAELEAKIEVLKKDASKEINELERWEHMEEQTRADLETHQRIEASVRHEQNSEREWFQDEIAAYKAANEDLEKMMNEAYESLEKSTQRGVK